MKANGMGWPQFWPSYVGRSDQASRVRFWPFGLSTKTNLWSDLDVGSCSPGTPDAVPMVDPRFVEQSGFTHESLLGVLVLDDVVALYGANGHAGVATEQLHSHSSDQAFGAVEAARGIVRNDTEMFDDDGSCTDWLEFHPMKASLLASVAISTISSLGNVVLRFRLLPHDVSHISTLDIRLPVGGSKRFMGVIVYHLPSA